MKKIIENGRKIFLLKNTNFDGYCFLHGNHAEAIKIQEDFFKKKYKKQNKNV